MGFLPAVSPAAWAISKLDGKKSPEKLRAKASLIETKRGIPGGQPIESGSMVGDAARRRGMIY